MPATDRGGRPPKDFRAAVARGPIVLDAGTGTRLLALGADIRQTDPCLWTLDRPESVREVHGRDVAAGADAVLTNTFGANRVWLDRYARGADVARVNRQAVALAREAVGPDRFVIGSIGPSVASHPRELAEQVDLLAEAGVNALLFETLLPDEAERILESLGPTVGGGLPRLMSLVEWPGAGTPGLARRLEDLGAWSLGVNCVPGVDRALEVARALAGATYLPLLVKPSASLPGTTPAAPETFAAAVPDLLACGVRLLGGCCGTNHRHVAALRRACYDASPTSRPDGQERPT